MCISSPKFEEMGDAEVNADGTELKMVQDLEGKS
jgi:hypothetical protein